MHLSGGQRQASRGSSVRMGEGREAGVNTGSCDWLQSSSLHSNSDSSHGALTETKKKYNTKKPQNTSPNDYLCVILLALLVESHHCFTQYHESRKRVWKNIIHSPLAFRGSSAVEGPMLHYTHSEVCIFHDRCSLALLSQRKTLSPLFSACCKKTFLLRLELCCAFHVFG